uniref:Large ribosomal subunit protein uL3 n=1 Tax=Caldisericum exile TaxID=693075 RepID=A0A7C4TV50_9BACT
MAKGILGLKIGMTSVYLGDTLVPVTVIQAGPCTIVDKRTKETHGYNAVALGFLEVKQAKLNKPMRGFFEKKNLPSFRFLKEVRDMDGDIGETITVEMFKDVKYVKVTGTSMGKGFQGVVKRWGFGGWPRTHGHEAERRPGSIGQRATPGRVFKGMKMAGHLGNDTVTIRNLEVIKVIPDKNLILVKGSVPGPDRGLLLIRA